MTLLRRAFGACVLVCAFATPGSAQTPVELDGLVVTATPTPVELSTLGNHVTLIDGDALLARGIARVADALREVPGLSVARSGSFGGVTSVFFRGGESDYVQVLIDGVQVNQPGGAFDFSGLTTENVERIEIVRGPSSALHGSDAVAGVIQIVTRNGAGVDGFRASADLRGGSYGRRDGTLSASGTTGSASYAVSLSRTRTDGILAFNNDAENTVLSARTSIALGDDTRASVAARVSDRTFAFPTDFTGAVVDTNQFTFADETSLAVTLERKVGERLLLEAKVTRFATESGTDDRRDGPADTLGYWGSQSLDDYDRSALDVRGTWTLSEAWTATAGTEFERQEVRSFNASESQYGPSNGRSTNARSNRALFGHLSGALAGVDLNGGVRFEDNERFGSFTSWQLGASVPLAEGTRVRGVAGRAIKEPTFFETFAQGFALGNPDLRPETSTSWELGIEQSFAGDAIRVQATYFDQAFEDLIQYTFVPPVAGDPNYFNVAAADARGLELGAEASIAGVRVFADWTWLDTEVVDSGFDSGPGATFVNGAPLLRRPAGSGRIGASVRPIERLRVDAVVRRVGERDDRDFNAFPAAAVVLDAYTLLDFDLGVHVLDAVAGRPGLDLTLRVENATDADWVEVFGYRSPGRGIYLGGRLEWRGR